MISRRLHGRLLVERAIMIKTYPYFGFYKSDNIAYVRGWYRSTAGNNYHLKLIFSDYYPDRIPELYLLSPKTLWKYCLVGTINQLEASHQFHTLSSDFDDHIQLCHYGSEKWHAACTSIGVMTRGLLWIEAYEDHLKTGEDINTIINQWKRRKQWEETLNVNE